MKIHAMRAGNDEKWRKAIYDSLRRGEARFGWSSYTDPQMNMDLHRLRPLVQEGKATEDELECWHPFLLELKPDDYIVYINIPEYGTCTLAKVSREYYWKAHTDLHYEWGYDGNHCLGVDPESVRTFDRNGNSVDPYLRSRLKLQGKHWRIYAEQEFQDLLRHLENRTEATPNGQPFEFLQNKMEQVWKDIARLIQGSHPGKTLEHLVCDMFNAMPGVRAEVNSSCFRSDNGADVIVEYMEGPADFPALSQSRKMVVQVKSYEGGHYNLQAVDDIKRAINCYSAKCGLILTTGEETEVLRNAVEQASTEEQPIALCAGPQTAQLMMKYLLERIIKK